MNLTTTDIMESRITVFNIRNLRRIDLLFATLVLCLAVIGLFVLYSASRSISSDVPYYLKQASFLLVGSLTALLFVCVDYRFLLSIAPTIYIIGIVLLMGVMAFGTTVKGGQRWLTLGPLRLQPSEQMKLVLVFMLALDRPKAQIEVLQQVANLLQSPDVVAGLMAARTKEEVLALLTGLEAAS